MRAKSETLGSIETCVAGEVLLMANATELGSARMKSFLGTVPHGVLPVILKVILRVVTFTDPMNPKGM
jgi:hypothetical protein